MPTPARTCPLCDDVTGAPCWADETRAYWRCPTCALIFVAAEQHLTRDAELAIYDCHENDPADAGYRRFLSRLTTPLLTRLEAGADGLDFGSGPGPTLPLMMRESGHRMALYDPYYAPDRSALKGLYDFITATEVVEHLAAPGRELTRLWHLIQPGGWLGLMTKLATGDAAFRTWHYHRDPTHISFFSKDSFAWLGNKWGVTPEFIGDDVILFQKGSAS